MTQRDARALLAALAGLLLTVCAAPAQSQSDPEVIERPEAVVGNWWEFSDNRLGPRRYTVVAKEKDSYVLVVTAVGVAGDASTGGSRFVVDLDGWPIKTVAPDGKERDTGDKYAWVKFPLRVGRSWSFFVNSTTVKGDRASFSFSCKPEQWDTVEVGGRDVRALKVVCLQRNRNLSGTFANVVWYAPEAKSIVKLTSDYLGGPWRTVTAWGSTASGGGAVTVSPPAPVPGASAPRAERPTYKVGDKWIRSDGPYELTRVDRDVYIFTAGAGREFRLTRDLGVARIVLDDRIEFDFDPAPVFTWPLEVGKWGVVRATLRSAPPRPLANFTGAIRVAWRVEAYEDVQVAGARLKAFRISQKIETEPTSFGSGQHVGQFSLWYAPDVQRYVKAQGDVPGLDWELTGTDKPGAPPVMAAPPAPPPLAPPPPISPPVAKPSADTEAPKVAINYPPAGARVEGEEIVVLGLVTDNVGVERVQVTVNGVEVPQPRDIDVTGRGVAIRAPAKLRPGDNVIEITATDKAGNVAQAVRTVKRVAPAVAATPPAPKVAARWAVVIGVGEYENKAIPRLRYAVRDAQAMYDFLTTAGGYPKQNVILLTDTTADKPTLQNIRRALGNFLSRRPGREDMVLIYYAGHGAPEVDAAGNESDGLSKYLIPRDADPDSLYSTAFPMDEIQRIFARIQSERVVMLLDTCYSGTAGGRTFARQQTRAGGISDQFLERLTRSRGRVVITASGPNEVALESPALGHGIFTYYLLEGLSGKADRNGDGIVTVSELYEYVEDQVDRAARLAGGRQRPLMKGEIEGTLPLSKAGGR